MLNFKELRPGDIVVYTSASHAAPARVEKVESSVVYLKSLDTGTVYTIDDLTPEQWQEYDELKAEGKSMFNVELMKADVSVARSYVADKLERLKKNWKQQEQAALGSKQRFEDYEELVRGFQLPV